MADDMPCSKCDGYGYVVVCAQASMRPLYTLKCDCQKAMTSPNPPLDVAGLRKKLKRQMGLTRTTRVGLEDVAVMADALCALDEVERFRGELVRLSKYLTEGQCDLISENEQLRAQLHAAQAQRREQDVDWVDGYVVGAMAGHDPTLPEDAIRELARMNLAQLDKEKGDG